MIYVFLGKEINIIKEKLEQLVKEFDITSTIKYNFTDNDLMDVIIEACYPNIFGGRKLIILEDFSFKKIKDSDEENLKKFIDSNNENIIVLKCLDEKLDERKNLTKLIKQKGKVINCGKLDYKDLSKYITDMFQKENIKISFNQVKRILDLCEYNTDIAISETKKLLLYKIGDNSISDDDIDNVVSKSNEKELFALSEYVLKKEVGNCINSYRILVDSNVDATIIIDNIAKQFRLLFQVKSLYGTVNEGAISNILDVNPYTIKKIIPYINAYKKDEILDKLLKLSEMDSDIKIKGYDKNKVIEMFFLTL
ncbi:MAG: DNA polymerase III subunit delta [bacterium]|nr:DNA polymerase III subunit delta [bacterium]